MNIRGIPMLDINGSSFAMGIQFEGHRVLGDIEHAAMPYFEQGAEKIDHICAVASRHGRDCRAASVERTPESGRPL